MTPRVRLERELPPEWARNLNNWLLSGFSGSPGHDKTVSVVGEAIAEQPRQAVAGSCPARRPFLKGRGGAPNGRASAFQADDAGSSPVPCSILDIRADMVEAVRTLQSAIQMLDGGIEKGIPEETLRRRTPMRVKPAQRLLEDVVVRCAGWRVER